jgi:hypothetical protein
MAEQGKSQRVRMNAFQIRQMNHVDGAAISETET